MHSLQKLCGSQKPCVAQMSENCITVGRAVVIFFFSTEQKRDVVGDGVGDGEEGILTRIHTHTHIHTRTRENVTCSDQCWQSFGHVRNLNILFFGH